MQTLSNEGINSLRRKEKKQARREKWEAKNKQISK